MDSSPPGNGKTLADLETRLAGYSGPDRVVDSREFWEIEGTRPRTERRFVTGIPSLDKHTEGVETGELVVVSGPTGQGKTTLLDTIGRRMSSDGAKCLWFSFEVTPRNFMAKYQSDGAPVIYVPLERKSGSVSWIEQRVHEAKIKHGCRVVFIDHMHFVVDMARMRNPSLEIGAVMRFLKSEVALKHNVAVFLISHLTKVKFEEEPSENDLRDSSFVAQESDQVWIIYRRPDENKSLRDENPYSNRARLVVCKSRRTGVLKARVSMVKIGDNLVEENATAAVPLSEDDAWVMGRK